MSRLTIKDLEVDKLLKKDSTFFSSTSFQEHTTLFNSLKTYTPLLTSPVNVDTFTDDLVTFTVEKLADYYDALEFFPNDELEERKLLILLLRAATLEITDNTIPVLDMDTSTLDFKDDLEYRLERVYRTESEIYLNRVNNTALQAINYNAINTVIPEKTSNPINDIIQKIKYYNTSENPNIFFQSKQELNVIKDLILNILNTGTLTEYLSSKKLFMNRRLKKDEIIKILINSLSDRYENSSSKKTLEYSNPPLSELVINSLRNALLPYTINCNEYVLTNTSTFTITDDNIPNNFLVIDNNAIITPSSVVTTGMDTVFTFSTPITGKIFALYTSDTLRNLKDKFNLDTITYKHVINSNTISFYSDEILKGVFFEIYSNNIRVYPTNTVIGSDYITLTFNSPITMQGFFIPNIAINSHLNYFNLNENTVEEFLSASDVFTVRYKIL